MAKLASYKKLHDIFEDFCTRHVQVQTYKTGELDQIISNESLTDRLTYPLVFGEDNGFSSGPSEVGNSFTFWILDIVHENSHGDSTEVDIKSNMQQIARDLHAYVSRWPTLGNNDYSLMVDVNAFGSYVTDKTGDKLTGVSFDMTIRQASNLSTCAIPFI